MSRPLLGYWDIRGIAEPIRYLLTYKNVDFEDYRYYTREDWLEDKDKLEFDFPNLPYYIDGNVKLTQSAAIMRYLACKHGLIGKTEEEKIQVDVLEQQIMDIRLRLIVWSYYENDYEKAKPDLLKNAALQFEMFSNCLNTKKYLCGNNITYVDFMAYDTFDFYWYLIPSLLNDFSNIKEYVLRIRSLPELQTLFAKQKRWPFFGPIANFGGRGPEPARD